MPLRDHFRSPLDDAHSWDELHGMWPAVIVQHLIKILPEPYFAAPSVHLGSIFEVDVATYRDAVAAPNIESVADSELSIATYAAPKPTLALEPELANQDAYEVRVYDSRRNRRLVAAIEIVSPSNKDRPENHESFVANAASLVKNDVCVSIVDVVGTMEFNLYADLLRAVNGVDPALGDTTPPIYAVTLRTRFERRRKLLDTWYHPLDFGRPLPTLPIWLREKFAVSLELEASYEETCRTLRIR